VTSYTYDAVGNRLTETDRNNHTTSYAYNADNKPTSVTTPKGEVTSSSPEAGSVVRIRASALLESSRPDQSSPVDEWIGETEPLTLGGIEQIAQTGCAPDSSAQSPHLCGQRSREHHEDQPERPRGRNTEYLRHLGAGDQRSDADGDERGARETRTAASAAARFAVEGDSGADCELAFLGSQEQVSNAFGSVVQQFDHGQRDCLNLVLGELPEHFGHAQGREEVSADCTEIGRR
jgi:hypothetical protein